MKNSFNSMSQYQAEYSSVAQPTTIGYQGSEVFPPTVPNQAQYPPVEQPTAIGYQGSEVLPPSVPTNNGFVTSVQQPQGAFVPAQGNTLPNTTVSTGPVFRIKGEKDSNFADLNELVSQTYAYAQEHQRDSAKLALAMQQHGQQTGYPSNVSVYSGPIFDIDLTGYGFTPYNDPNKNY